MTDRLTLDHLVYGVPDLAMAMDEFKNQLGVAPVFGGRHEGLGTHNAILPLAGETYLELIARDPNGPEPGQPRPFDLDALRSARLVAWAVRSRAIEIDVEHAKEQGFDPGIVFGMTRKEPNGETLHWKLSLRREPFGDGLVPFVIDWGTTRHPSAVAASQTNPDDPHPTTSRCEMSAFSATHPDPVPVRTALVALGATLEVRDGPSAGLQICLTGPAGSLQLGKTS
jgi:hypothetical protein